MFEGKMLLFCSAHKDNVDGQKRNFKYGVAAAAAAYIISGMKKMSNKVNDFNASIESKVKQCDTARYQ